MTTTVNTINGTEGNNRLTGTSGNDVINGNGGNDRINGGSGSDTLNGGAGKDELNGGSGNDILDGGSGSDELEGGSGNDRLIYNLAENNVNGRITYDEYEGGSGTDTLELRFTRTEWMNTSYQAVLQNYLNWANKSGSGCRWDDDFTFRFGNARLEIEDIEKLVVKVDDEFIDNVGNNMVKLLDDEIKITEDDTAVRKIDVLDNDSVNYLVKDLKLETGPAKGSVVLVKDNPNNANTWYFNYTPDSTFYQYLIKDEPATESFTYKVTDAKGLSAIGTVNIKITGVNNEADITFTQTDELIEDENLEIIYSDDASANVNSLFSRGTITITDKDRGESNLLTSTPVGNNLGQLKTKSFSITDPITNQVIPSGIVYTYSVENSKVQYLAQDEIKTEKFTIVSTDGTTQEIVFSIKGVNDAAEIGGKISDAVIESGSSNNGGTPIATGQLTASDVDNAPNTFQAISIDQKSSKAYGKYSITADGNWTYTLDNETIKALNSDSEALEDTFKVFSIDGTSQEIKITINGADDVVNSKPVIEGKGRSAIVQELINLKYDNPIIAKYAAKGGDYDYLHVRTGQFYVKDIDLDDSITLELETGPNAYLKTGYLGEFKPTFTGIKIDGKYLVTWKYEVNDSKLEPLDSPFFTTYSKDQTYTLKFKSGADTLSADVVIHFEGRNEITFSDDVDENNIYIRIDNDDNIFDYDGNEIFYLGTGNVSVRTFYDSDVIYGEDGNDQLIFDENNSVFFGGDGNDTITVYFSVEKGLIFGGNGNDTFIFNFYTKSEAIDQNIYTWGGDESDTFQQFQNSTAQIGNWIMDFNSSKPSNGGDIIRFNEKDNSSHTWDKNTTKLEEKTADSKHPFLSDGASYYELQAKSTTDGNWYSVFNIVGTNITLDGLITNENLV